MERKILDCNNIDRGKQLNIYLHGKMRVKQTINVQFLELR